MNREYFDAKIENIRNLRENGEIGPLGEGFLLKELCREWLNTHETLPPGFEGFADETCSFLRRRVEGKQELVPFGSKDRKSGPQR